MKAIFFDRDGVLVNDNGPLHTREQIEVRSGAADFLAYSQSLGYLNLVVTNQTAIARGLISYMEAIDLQKEIEKQLLEQNSNAIIHKVFICPHHPKATALEYRQICECRKPKNGMILQAIDEFKLKPRESFLVGDRPTDIYAGNSTGIKSFLLRSDKSQEALIESDLQLKQEWLIPFASHQQFADLKAYL